jgi:hypothetical protein
MTILRHLTILLATATAAFAAPPAAAPAPVTPATIAQWEAALAAREQRADLLRGELKSLDSRIEARVDSLVKALRSISDSKDSRTKVARMKEQNIDALKRNIEYYRNKRAALQEELRRPTLNLTEEQKRRGIAIFDAHIEKRVAQIIELQKSLPTHKDYARYKASGDSWAGTTYSLNQDYVQNQQVTGVTNRQRREIEEDLRKSIARLEQNNRGLRAQMDAAPYASRNKELAGEIAKNETLIAERRKQLATALAPVETPTRAVGLHEAVDLDRALNTAIGELRRDFNTLFARYNALIPELSAINSTRAAIAAAKARAKPAAPPASAAPSQSSSPAGSKAR